MLSLYLTVNGAPAADGPVLTVLGGEIVLTELGQFSESSVVLAAADERAILAMNPYTLVEIVQDTVGTLCYGYVLDPKAQITDRDEHTITLTLAPLTVEATWRRTRRGWIASNNISIIAERLGALTPGWTGIFTDRYNLDPSGQPYDIAISVNLNNPTVAGGFLQVAKQFGHYARQGFGLPFSTLTAAIPDGSSTAPISLVSTFGFPPMGTVAVGNEQIGYTGRSTTVLTGITRGVNGTTGGAHALDDRVTMQNVDPIPLRTFEMGQFGLSPTVWLTSANGGDADAMRDNSLIRLVASVERQPNNVADLVNVAVPFGGGQDNESLVTLERLWRILNDPSYVNYGRYGTQAGSVFPEYDVNYPISDPENPPTGLRTYILPATGQVVSVSATLTDAILLANGFVLYQGALGTRAFTNDGHTDYLVHDAASYALYGFKEGQYIDSSLNYTDNSVANQELTARALYVAMVTQCKRYAHPHHTFMCTAEGKGRPTRAGDLVAVDYQRVSAHDSGAVVEMNVTENLRVMKVVRSFNGEDPPVDTYTLSNLGRFDQDDTSAFADVARQLPSIQMNQGTSVAPMTIGPFAADVDALHPLVVTIDIPRELFRWRRCTFRVDFQPYRATTAGTLNPAGTQIQITTPDNVTILIPTPSDLGINDTFQATAANIGGVPIHVHGMGIIDASKFFTVSGTPATIAPNNYAWIGGSGSNLVLNANGISGSLLTGQNLGANVDLAPTSHPHNVPIAKTIRGANTTIGHLPPRSFLANLPQHVHPPDQHIPDGPLPISCFLTINGQSLPSGSLVTSGARNADGGFYGSFALDNIGPYVELPGQTVTLTLTPGTNATNPYGIGRYQCSGTFFGEFGGLAVTVRPS